MPAEKEPAGETLALATAELIEHLNDLAFLIGRHGDTTSDNFKRTTGVFAMTAVQDFLRKMEAPKDILQAIDEVRGGIADINKGIPARILTANALGKPPAPTNFEVLRAQIAALAAVMTSNVAERQRATIARDLRKKLLPQLNVVFDQSASTKNPEKALTNLAGLYLRDKVGNDTARWHFNYWREKYQRAFAKVEPERRDLLLAAVVKQIKGLLDDAPSRRS